MFGRTSTRQECVECTEHLYKRLLKLSNSSDLLKFDTLALLAVGKDGSLDEEKLKAVVRLFRPDRQGYLSLVDFAKSIDSCYKEMRLLKASVASSSKVSTDGNISKCFLEKSLLTLFAIRWTVHSKVCLTCFFTSSSV